MARGSRLKSILSIILVIALLAVGVGMFTSFDGKKVDTIKPGAFSRGGLNSSGEYVKTKTSIYTEETFGCQGLRVESDFEFIGTYDVYYYDYNGKFLEAKKGLKGIYDEDYPMAKLARIVINPELSADEDKVTWYDVRSIAKMLKITVNKDQAWKYESENLYDESKIVPNSGFVFVNGEDVTVEVNESPWHQRTEYIPVSYESYDVFIKLNAVDNNYSGAVIITVDDVVVARDDCLMKDIDVGEWVKLSVSVDDVTDDLNLLVKMPTGSDCYIFGYN